MGSVVLDSSVLIALYDADHPLHEPARALAARWTANRARLLVPASAYSEALVAPVRVGRERAIESEADGGSFEIVAIDRDIARIAARARGSRPSIRLPDALVIATALWSGADLATLDRGMQDAHAELAKSSN